MAPLNTSNGVLANSDGEFMGPLYRSTGAHVMQMPTNYSELSLRLA